MGISARITIAFLCVWALSTAILVHTLIKRLPIQFYQATEETLVDFAAAQAVEIEKLFDDREQLRAKLRDAFERVKRRKLSAQIYDMHKQSTVLHVYATDSSGRVIFDSDSAGAEGRDYSAWQDVARTLQGGYGARTSPHPEHGTMLYVAQPIKRESKIIGVVSVGKPH